MLDSFSVDYFVIFVAIGFIVGLVNKYAIITLGMLIAISILWGITSGAFWGFASMLEVSLGYAIYRYIKKEFDI